MHCELGRKEAQFINLDPGQNRLLCPGSRLDVDDPDMLASTSEPFLALKREARVIYGIDRQADIRSYMSRAYVRSVTHISVIRFLRSSDSGK